MRVRGAWSVLGWVERVSGCDFFKGASFFLLFLVVVFREGAKVGKGLLGGH